MLAAKNPTKRRPKSPTNSKRRVNLTKPRKNLPSDDSTPLPSIPKNLSSASTILRRLLGLDEVKHLFDPEMRQNSSMVYTKGVTIWMLILQRLCKGATLEQTVSHVLQHDRHLLPQNKRTEEFSLSANPSGYSSARGKLDIEEVRDFSNRVCNAFAHCSEPVIDGRRVFLLDGTTITLEPTAELQKAFPPAPNQHGQSVWPVAKLMVAAEMQTGSILQPQVDPMYGPERTSEAKQSFKVVEKLPAESIVIADAGFGIFSVAHHTMLAGHDILFRLTKARFHAMVKKASLVESGKGYKSYQLNWIPSAKDRKTNPHLPSDAALEVILHCVELNNGGQLYLVSSLDFDACSAADLYSRRYEIEFDIRDLKVTMDAENLRSRSVEMAMKELMTSVIAFNLTMQFRRQAARLVRLEPRRLSFKSCWVVFQDHLLLGNEEDFEGWQIRFVRALTLASQKRLPQRSKPRSYPRVAHTRRQKSTKFMKAKSKKAAIKKPDPPPSGTK